MKWFDKKRNKILAGWENNSLTMAEAAAELIWLGYTPDKAWDLLAEHAMRRERRDR